ncbi:MAG: DUF433 domain-containing protein [Deltaproteobacteria bacterium]|nr:DUF433 domain-containing protein [Deltaproteobacteria bacterium]
MKPYITCDERGVPWLTGTNTKVREVILDHLAHGWSVEEIHFQHPHLSLVQIHAAFVYYYEHQKEMDQLISEQVARVEALRDAAPRLLLRDRLHPGREHP